MRRGRLVVRKQEGFRKIRSTLLGFVGDAQGIGAVDARHIRYQKRSACSVVDTGRATDRHAQAGSTRHQDKSQTPRSISVFHPLARPPLHLQDSPLAPVKSALAAHSRLGCRCREEYPDLLPLL